MKYNLVDLISTILDEAGMADIVDSDLDHHSTIALNMNDGIPAIYIKNENDTVWIWSSLCDYYLNSLTYNSARLFPLMFNYNEEVFYTGQPCLYPVDDTLELRAQVKECFLESPEKFLIVLDSYLSVMQEYQAVLV